MCLARHYDAISSHTTPYSNALTLMLVINDNETHAAKSIWFIHAPSRFGAGANFARRSDCMVAHILTKLQHCRLTRHSIHTFTAIEPPRPKINLSAKQASKCAKGENMSAKKNINYSRYWTPHKLRKFSTKDNWTTNDTSKMTMKCRSAIEIDEVTHTLLCDGESTTHFFVRQRNEDFCHVFIHYLTNKSQVTKYQVVNTI